MARCWKKECFKFSTKGSYRTTIANVKRKRIPNSGGSYRKTCADTRYRQQISVRWTGISHSQLLFWCILSFTVGLWWKWLWRLVVSKYQQFNVH